MAAIISDYNMVVKWLPLFQIMIYCRMTAIISDFRILVEGLLLFQIIAVW